MDKGIWTHGAVLLAVTTDATTNLGTCIEACNLEPACLFANYHEGESGIKLCHLTTTNTSREVGAGSATYHKLGVPPPMELASLSSDQRNHT